jgi:hypothetical protein
MLRGTEGSRVRLELQRGGKLLVKRLARERYPAPP